MIRFDGEVVLVTGAGRGLGKSYARLLAARGAYVIVHDAGVDSAGEGSDPGIADSMVKEIERAGGHAHAEYANLESPDACRALIERTLAARGRLDAMIHNAGVVTFAPVEETDDVLCRRLLAINLEAALWLSRAVFRTMRERGGRIVFTTSRRALDVDSAASGLSAYAAAKAGIVGLTVTLACEGRESGIAVNAVAPVAATRMLRRGDPEGALGPDTVAPGVVLLASRVCPITGGVLHAAGGRFFLGRWAAGATIDLSTDATPEALALHWPLSSRHQFDAMRLPTRRDP